MKLNFFTKLLGSGFYSGYSPYATGTVGSIVGLIIYFIPGFENLSVSLPAIFIFTLIGIYSGNKFEVYYGKDPKECTIDEVVGMWITLLFLPKNLWLAIVGLIVWRLFDIVKPYPARNFEKLPGGFGVMADDISSALYACIFMNVGYYFFSKFLG